MISNELKQDLSALICEGNTVFLPKTPLNNYNNLKKTLVKACGKYKKNTFVFPYPSKPIIDTLITGEVIDFKKEFQFFATPPKLASFIVDQILWDKKEVEILEPEAGHGVFIDEILTRNEGIIKNIDAVELSGLNFSVLQEKYNNSKNVNLIQGDFLEFNPEKKYDIIIANPPFSKNQDIDHILKMYSLLKKGGQLISIASKSWTFGSQKKQIEFKNFVDENGTLYDLDHGSFKSSGTNVGGVIVSIFK